MKKRIIAVLLSSMLAASMPAAVYADFDTDARIYANTGMEKPYFIAKVESIELPWVLEEQPFD